MSDKTSTTTAPTVDDVLTMTDAELRDVPLADLLGLLKTAFDAMDDDAPCADNCLGCQSENGPMDPAIRATGDTVQRVLMERGLTARESSGHTGQIMSVLNRDGLLKTTRRALDDLPTVYGAHHIMLALDEVVTEAGSGYVYPAELRKKQDQHPDSIGACLYVGDDGAPLCIVGKVLALLDPELLTCMTVQDNGNAYSLRRTGRFTDDAVSMMSAAQGTQDNTDTWGTARDKARDTYRSAIAKNEIALG